MNLHFEEYGSGSPLIILHGLFGSLDNWRSISKELGKHFRVFALDQRNHGRSPHCNEHNYKVMADDLREFLSRHSIESASVLGHSMGGKTAMQFSLSYPHKVDSLIVVDILPKEYKERQRESDFALHKLLELNNASTFKEANSAMSAYIQEPSVRQLFLKNLDRNERGRLQWRINMKALIENYERMSEAVFGGPFSKPCLFIRGGSSTHTPDEEWACMMEQFPLAERVTIPGAGHWVHAEKPIEFIKVILDFLTPASKHDQIRLRL